MFKNVICDQTQLQEQLQKQSLDQDLSKQIQPQAIARAKAQAQKKKNKETKVREEKEQQDQKDLYWMNQALSLANQAESIGEVPVGAVIVVENELIGQGFNQPISTNDPTAHAEIIALRQAAQTIKNYRLVNAALYVTLEPCAMCAGAMVHARLERLIFGAKDNKAGMAGSKFNLLQESNLNHHISCLGGVLAEESGFLLQEFFRKRR